MNIGFNNRRLENELDRRASSSGRGEDILSGPETHSAINTGLPVWCIRRECVDGATVRFSWYKSEETARAVWAEMALHGPRTYMARLPLSELRVVTQTLNSIDMLNEAEFSVCVEAPTGTVSIVIDLPDYAPDYCLFNDVMKTMNVLGWRQQGAVTCLRREKPPAQNGGKE